MAIYDTGGDYGAEIAQHMDDFVEKAVASEAALDAALADLAVAYDANIATPTYH